MSQRTVKVDGKSFVIQSRRTRAGFTVNVSSQIAKGMYHVQTLDRSAAECRAYLRFVEESGEAK